VLPRNRRAHVAFLSAGETAMPSTSLRDISYDAASRTLDVTFIASGRRYRYFDVELEEYAALSRAFAKGVHFNNEIKPRHRYALLA
jgi:hypothetical protein